MTKVNILDALDYIEKQLCDGYLDISLSGRDDLELSIVAAAIAEFKVNHRLTEFDI